MTLRLYHAPMTCSLASCFALAEAQLEHELIIVDVDRGDNRASAYLAINPVGKVPALVTEAGVVAENPAILTYIADLVPHSRLLPTDPFARAQAASWLSWGASVLHPAYTRAIRPEKVTTSEKDFTGIVDKALDVLGEALTRIDRRLVGREWLLEQLSVCDLYLLVFALWRRSPGLAGRLPAFPEIDRWQTSMLARPALARCVGEDMNTMRMHAEAAQADVRRTG